MKKKRVGRRETRSLILLAVLLIAPASARADEPPSIEHTPSPCTVPDKAISLCASVSDDNQVATARIYFRRQGEDFYQFVDMAFTGVSYCGTLPAPREGKVKAVEYYLQAVDDQFQPTRTSNYQLSVMPEGACGFPPVEKDAKKVAAIKVFATNRKQGSKLDTSFEQAGVTFVPAR